MFSLLLTVNTFRPFRGFLTIPAFFASWLVNELPFYTLAGQGLVALALAHYGAAGALPGQVGLVLLTASWAGVVVLWRRGRDTRLTMEAALGPLAGVEQWPRVPGHKLWLPFSPARPTVHRTRDVVFGDAGKKRLRLDIYRPRAPGTRRPAIVQIHGGAWILGDKREQGLPLLYHLAEHGWVGFNVNYRLSPRATFPDHLIDVKRALAWIREHAEEYGVDPDFICVTGGSAGGHLAALVALTANDPQYQPGFEHADTSVQGAVPFYAIYCFTGRLGLYPKEFHGVLLERMVMKATFADAPEKFSAASPLDRMHASAPPMFIVHGDNDSLAPVEYARHFAVELEKVSTSPVHYAELRGAQHAFDIFHSPRTVRVIEGVERFLSALHLRHRQRDVEETDRAVA